MTDMVVNSLGFVFATYILDIVEEASHVEMPTDTDKKSLLCLARGQEKGQTSKMKTVTH